MNIDDIATPVNTKNVGPKGRVGRPRGSNKQERLAEIMPVARRLFSEKGFAQTTFKDVGKELGISHAALYSYFPSKKEMYKASVAETQNLLLPFFIEALAMKSSLRERIGHVLLAIAAEHDKDSSITGLLAAVPIEMRRHPELVEMLVEEDNLVMSSLEALFDEAKAAGEIKSEASSQDLIAAILGGGVGVALFQYGLQSSDLTTTMKVFVSLLEAELFN
ncbi:MAG: TetR/AcrR family transcriptional regulator [Pseudomonadales bacterium]|nr:TetR/AcrR family transcriptional regulator [Pseudomonadales bacterium]